MTNKILEKISEKYPLQEKDVGGFAKIKVRGTTFKIAAYYAEGLGHVSVMKSSAMFGLVKMDVLIINPIEIDMPIYSYERIALSGANALFIELYDTLLGEYNKEGMNIVKSAFAGIMENNVDRNWYGPTKLDCGISKRCNKGNNASLDTLSLSHFEAYFNAGKNVVPVSDREMKQKKAYACVNEVLNNGSTAIEILKLKLNSFELEELYKDILFGIK